MNQRGEMTLSAALILLVMATLVLLCALELRRSFSHLEKRTKLFLCLKETKGEFVEFMKFMGRTNWGIKNTNRAKLIMLFIPGLQGASMEAEKLKKTLQYIQEGRFLLYLKTISRLKAKGCPLDPRLALTPFESGARLFNRDAEGAVKLKEKEWNYYFYTKPYFVELSFKSHQWEGIKPRMLFESKERPATFRSLLSVPL